MSTTTKIGLGHPILTQQVERLQEEGKAFNKKCNQLQERLNQSRLALGNPCARENHLSTIQDAAILHVIEGSIFLSPEQKSLQTQITRLESYQNISGSSPSSLEVLQNLRQRIDYAASSTRILRDHVQQQLAPGQTWTDWLFNSHSKETFNNLVLERTNQIVEDISFPEEEPKSNENLHWNSF